MKKSTHWGWLLGILVVVAMTPALWHVRPLQAESTSHKGRPKVAPTMVAAGRTSYWKGSPDWSKPLAINWIQLGTTRQELARLWMNKVDKYWRSSRIGTSEVWTGRSDPMDKIAFDPDGRVASISGKYLVQLHVPVPRSTDKIVSAKQDKAGPPLEDVRIAIPTEDVLAHLGEPDSKQSSVKGTVWIWTTETGETLKLYENKRFVLSASDNGVF